MYFRNKAAKNKTNTILLLMGDVTLSEGKGNRPEQENSEGTERKETWSEVQTTFFSRITQLSCVTGFLSCTMR